MIKYLVIIAIVVLSAVVFVNGQYPLQIYGTLSQGGNVIPDGTTVSFVKGGITLLTTTTKDSRYGYEEPVFIDGEELSIGDTIAIEVNGREVYELTYLGGADIGIDLEIPANVEISGAATLCTPNWECSDWSACISSVQTRTCVDRNRCGNLESRPEQEQRCTVAAAPVTPTPTTPTTPTTTVPQPTRPETEPANLAWLWYVGVVILIVLVGIVVVRRYQYYRHVPSQQPHRFIHLSLRHGHDENKIKESLADKGWKKQHVDSVIQVEKLRHYVIDQLNQGVDKEELRQYLINYGWSPEIVNEVIP
ncbi:hypothetical protein KY328_05005 [Candidatus Woesearchaeota archaeon]|nr:hypothetical protein [Candidatus Woesearchaeota archaeon]MBW3022257.1 hypothetical protein [Candidatus Woesearchaeota archaeon]